MAEENYVIDPGAQAESLGMNTPNLNIELIYGSDDPKKGFNIPNGKITKIELRENFFTKLPQLKLVLNDTGYLFNSLGFQIGNIFSLKITPIVNNADLLPKPYIDTQFKIESIEYSMDPDRKIYIYTINCMYGAEKYVNDICVWPQDDIDILHLDKEYTSKETLDRILTKAGLAFVDDYNDNTEDNMAWLNSSLTYCEFAEKLIKHGWVGEEDIPVLFVDREGTAHFNTINSLCKNQSSIATYMNTTTFQKKYGEANKTAQSTQKPVGVRLYTDIAFRNVGYIQNQGAYGIRATLFNPYNIRELNPIDFPVANIKLENLKAATLNDTCIRQKEYHDNKTRIANMSNKSAGQLDNIRYSYNGMHFKQTHEYYDYAPLHYESIKRSFYQQFVFITIDTLLQPAYDSDSTQRLNLGNKITINTSTVDYDNTIQTGDYIVVGLTHVFSTGGKYTIMATCVNDGINGVGKLRKESKINKENE